MPPTSSPHAGSRTVASSVEPIPTTSLLVSSRARLTGATSRYRSEAHDASDGTASPQKRAASSTSSSSDERKTSTRLKFAAPREVEDPGARSPAVAVGGALAEEERADEHEGQREEQAEGPDRAATAP